MKEIDYRYWSQIVENHELPAGIKPNQVGLLIALAENMNRQAMMDGGPWNTVGGLQSQFSELTGLLGLRVAGRGRLHRVPKGWNERALRDWAVERLDALYDVYMHVTPEEQSTPDCFYPERCQSMWFVAS